MVYLTKILSVFVGLVTTIQTGNLAIDSRAHLPVVHSLEESREVLIQANRISLNPHLRLPEIKGRQSTNSFQKAENPSKKVVHNQKKAFSQLINQFDPQLPFKVKSKWYNDQRNLWSSSTAVFKWQVGNYPHGFLTQNGRFITRTGDTWFVYGLFGPIKAVSKAGNVKYPFWGNRHNGIDLTARYGLPVYAAEEGIVGYTGLFQGNTVVIKHGSGYQTTYGHLSTIKVRKGQWVKKGQLIGKVGNSGTLNTHLHFEIDQWRGNTCYAINPLKFLSLNGMIVPQCDANRLNNNQSPYSQPDFAWNNPLKL